MGAKVGGSDSDYNNDMNVIPLVDIMLVLLILFIITIPPMTQSVLMDLPTRSNAPPSEAEKVTLRVEFDGSVTWNGNPADKATLKAFIAGASVQDPQPQVQIIADPNAEYKYVNDVLFLLQKGEIKKMGFVTVAR
jgi:biopolymer transport protein ExbD